MYKHKRRRKAYKTRGSNVSGDARRLRLKGGVGDSSWQSPARQPLKSTETKAVSNDWLLRSPSMSGMPVDPLSMETPVTSDRTVKQYFGTARDHRKKWNWAYSKHVQVEKHVLSQMSKLRSMARVAGEKDRQPSLLAKIETRSDVILWRSGLAASMLMARQMCRHGHVQRQAKDGGAAVVKHPSQSVSPGDTLCIDKVYWEKTIPAMVQYWKDVERSTPRYLVTDLKLGCVVLTRVPHDGEAVLPLNMTASVVPRLRK